MQTFEFINIVGSYRSMIEVVGETLEVEAQPKTILKAIKQRLPPPHKSCESVNPQRSI